MTSIGKWIEKKGLQWYRPVWTHVGVNIWLVDNKSRDPCYKYWHTTIFSLLAHAIIVFTSSRRSNYDWSKQLLIPSNISFVNNFFHSRRNISKFDMECSTCILMCYMWNFRSTNLKLHKLMRSQDVSQESQTMFLCRQKSQRGWFDLTHWSPGLNGNLVIACDNLGQ